MFDSGSLGEALATLGEVLKSRGEAFEVVAIGGGSLLLQGAIRRPTKDLDLVARVVGGKLETAEPLPASLASAVADVGRALGLGETWLNAGPASLVDYGLPDGFRERLSTRHYDTLTLHLAGRFDQVCFKLYATVDQGPLSKHAQDLRQLQPTASELIDAARWARTHDPSEGFRFVCMQALESLGVEVPDGF